MKAVMTTKMNRAVVATLISLEFVSQASAVLRPLFPFKPSPPSSGELIVTEEEVVLQCAKKPLPPNGGHAR